MNNTAGEHHVSKRPSRGFWWTLVILFVVLPALLWFFAKTLTSESLASRTRVIINCVHISLELTLGSKGEMIPLDFAYLRKQFAYLDTMADLRALRAIDDTHQCFVDAWGRPLIIRLGPSQRFEVISAGQDGFHGTPDDLHN